MRTPTFAVAAGALAAALTLGGASARDHDDDGGGDRRALEHGRRAGPPDPAYVKECGACHVAYAPALLPAASWRALFAGLDRHFGEDASVEPPIRAALERWVVERSAPDPRAAPREPPLRITELRWFRDEHDEVPADAAARPSIRSLSNCGACHPGAERWDFDEDRVRIPGR
jgi:hypothetical protein